jgi:hypothetical protein
MSSKYEYRDFDDNEDWVASGGGGGLPKVVEGEDEDYDSDYSHTLLKSSSAHSAKKLYNDGMKKMYNKFSPSKSKGGGGSGGGGGGGSGSSSGSSGSRRSTANRSFAASRRATRTNGKKGNAGAGADPLSLVVLLVDPISLRFELLSLDFDLASHIIIPNNNNNNNQRRNNNNNKNNNNTTPPQLTLTVQDVLNQITSDSLTEETLKLNLNKSIPIGLIDRTEKIHYGTCSLDTACSSRPSQSSLRTSSHHNAVTSSSTSASTTTSSASLCDLTYSGEPHRDVLLGYFISDDNEGEEDDVIEVSNEKIQKAIKLSKPIFMDPKVIQLMKNNGYNLCGWNGTKIITSNNNNTTNNTTKTASSSSSSSGSSSAIMLGKPLPAKKRSKKYFSLDNIIVKMILGLIVIVLATIMAWSIVSGGLNVIPSTSTTSTHIHTGGTTTTNDNNNNYIPHTFEGYIKSGYNSLSSRITQKSFVEQQQHNNNVVEGTPRSDGNTNVRSNSRDDNDNDDDNEIIDLDLYMN